MDWERRAISRLSWIRIRGERGGDCTITLEYEGWLILSSTAANSRDHANDPPTPHISLHSPPLAHHSHSLCCTPPDSIPQLSDGVARKLRVEVCFKKGEVRCWFSVGARDDTFQASDTGMEGTSSSDTQEEWIHLFHKVMPDKLESWNVMNEMTVVLSASTGGLAQAVSLRCRVKGGLLPTFITVWSLANL